jgi:hypothetical protein
VFARKIDEPILLIHGEVDNNSGHFRSGRNGTTTRSRDTEDRTLRHASLESHGYAARGSIEHTLYEMIPGLKSAIAGNSSPERSACDRRLAVMKAPQLWPHTVGIRRAQPDGLVDCGPAAATIRSPAEIQCKPAAGREQSQEADQRHGAGRTGQIATGSGRSVSELRLLTLPLGCMAEHPAAKNDPMSDPSPACRLSPRSIRTSLISALEMPSFGARECLG